jgi:drug/metabolite transporter (DMT)-like permease
VLLSALIHPIRDLTLKGLPNPSLAYLGVAVVWVAIAATHANISGQDLTLPDAAWPSVFVSAVGLSFYYYGTLAALRRGNLSVYYPIIRSSPLAIIVFSWALFGQVYSFWTLLGISLIILAGLAIQKTPGSFFDDGLALLLALLAMIASAAYSVADAIAMQQSAPPAAFLFWVYTLVSLLLMIACLLERAVGVRHAPKLIVGGSRGLYRILIACFSSYASYYLILLAFQLHADAAVVSAVRQASIPISVILAALLLKEPRFMQRMAWASVLAVGVAIIVSG